MLNLCLLTIFQQREKGLAVRPQNMINLCLLIIFQQRVGWCVASLGCAQHVSVIYISAHTERCPSGFGGTPSEHDKLVSVNNISSFSLGLVKLMSVNSISAEGVGWWVASLGHAKLLSVNYISAEGVGWWVASLGHA